MKKAVQGWIHLRYCFFAYAAGRTRTGTVARLILSQVRLPIPPQRQGHELLPICIDYNSTPNSNVQAFFHSKCEKNPNSQISEFGSFLEILTTSP